jgi:Toprim-like
MNTKQAKAEPLADFLGRIGHMPSHIRGNDVWYKSPFRPEERTASFKVDVAKNVWYDHGAGQGGTIIDLVGELHGTRDVSRVLTIIADILGTAPRVPVVPIRASSQAKAPPMIDAVSEVSDRLLEAYLAERGIPLDLARVYLKEVVYRVEDQRYVALAFGNDAGGYEVRNPRFKGSLGTKDITSLAQAESPDVAVFEGVFDFLSILKHYQRDRASGSVIVLNSLALMDRGIERLQVLAPERVHAYLDHDRAGQVALSRLAEKQLWQTLDASNLYAGHKDANAFLMAMLEQKRVSAPPSPDRFR